MNRQRFSFQVLIFFVLMTFLIISGCAGGGEEEATSPNTNDDAAYTQADLAGTWRIHKLANDPRWTRATFTVNESGVVSCVSYEDSTGANVCPASFDLQWTVANGAITASGDNAGSDVHMTMTSNFKLIAGTGAAADDSKEFLVTQRITEEITYSESDVRNKTFVYHSLIVGNEKKWVYGAGATSDVGAVTISSETDPAGSTTPPNFGTMSVGTDGIVTLTGFTDYRGFLSDDKKTIVGTFTDKNGDDQLMVIQITGQTYGAMPAGDWNAHGLVVGSSSYAPFWLYFTATADNSGTISFSNWEFSQPLAIFVVPDSADVALSGSGVVTSDTMALHGQLSDDNTFMVSTLTPYTDCYALTIFTDVP
ncbi:MAG: hypothetical protein LLG40_07150 [Deltaproteobacteria bacterium]|nr:hypothetical protein [Deltaproteobacteria bacterium]